MNTRTAKGAKLCDDCKEHPVNHYDGYRRELCCRCHVADGNPPADWHPACMKAYAERSEK